MIKLQTRTRRCQEEEMGLSVFFFVADLEASKCVLPSRWEKVVRAGRSLVTACHPFMTQSKRIKSGRYNTIRVPSVYLYNVVLFLCCWCKRTWVRR